MLLNYTNKYKNIQITLILKVIYIKASRLSFCLQLQRMVLGRVFRKEACAIEAFIAKILGAPDLLGTNALFNG